MLDPVRSEAEPVRTGIKDQSLPREGLARSRRWAGAAQLWVAVTLLTVIFGSAILAPFVAPFDPNAIALDKSLQPPSLEHWFGTDQLGRDVLSRVIWGGQVSLFIAGCAVILAGVAGSTSMPLK